MILDETVSVLVPLLGRLLKLLQLPPLRQVARHESHRLLLELRFVLQLRVELRVEAKRYLHLRITGLRYRSIRKLRVEALDANVYLDPRVLECSRSHSSVCRDSRR